MRVRRHGEKKRSRRAPTHLPPSGRRKAGRNRLPARRADRLRNRPPPGTRAPARRRPVWTGQLRLALVSVPVKLYPATKSGARLSFHQVHEPTGKRIRYEKVVPGVGPVEAHDIVKGYEISSGRYVLLEDEELDALKIEAKKTLDLIQFVDHHEIDPIWFDRPYYAAADGDLAEEAYAVLRDALRATKKVGLGQFVMRGREYVGALKPCGDGLLLETLRFADEVREAAPLFADVADEEPDEELLDLAKELIGRKAKPFKPEAFSDSYTDAVKALIDAKRKKKPPVDIEEDELDDGRGAKVIDLVEALKRSVRGGDEPKGGPAKTASGSKTSKRKAG
ncbi:Ku protein [Chenggangzhangella methanolivorans]|uniref:Non-homologous end joining protein Ku n=1 Tax=Chenggangzhangella methanolivorans TaxID=1437009 RepID=A0A9E6R5R1_9HYPH|nr:Ku protein [Chenggangzhangella methanolivorans]